MVEWARGKKKEWKASKNGFTCVNKDMDKYGLQLKDAEIEISGDP